MAAGAVVPVAALTIAPGSSQAVNAISGTRLTAASPARSKNLEAALRLVAGHPVVGVGPAPGAVSWLGPGGHLDVSNYVHNEYVQVLMELGTVGLILVLAVLAVLAAVAREVRRARRAGPSRQLWAAGIAALVALARGQRLRLPVARAGRPSVRRTRDRHHRSP